MIPFITIKSTEPRRAINVKYLIIAQNIQSTASNQLGT